MNYRMLGAMIGCLMLGSLVTCAQESGKTAPPVTATTAGSTGKTTDATNQELLAELKAIREELKATKEQLVKMQEQINSLKTDLLKAVAQAQPANRPKAEPDTTVYNIDIGNSPFLGSKDAKATIVIFFDIQCPYCSREWPKLQQIVKEFPNDARLVFKHYPLPFHKQAIPAAAATLAAMQQKGNDGFWKMFEMMMADPKKLDAKDFRGYAETMGLDLAAYDKFVADEEGIKTLLAPDKAEAAKCKVGGTPTILVNGLKMGAREVDDYRNRIKAILEGKDKVAPAEQPKPDAKPAEGAPSVKP